MYDWGTRGFALKSLPDGALNASVYCVRGVTGEPVTPSCGARSPGPPEGAYRLNATRKSVAAARANRTPFTLSARPRELIYNRPFRPPVMLMAPLPKHRHLSDSSGR